MADPQIRVLTNLKIRLLDDDLPQYAVAAKCGIHPSQLSLYALGKSTIRPKHLKALCRYFKCKQGEILGTQIFEYTPDEEVHMKVTQTDVAMLVTATERIYEATKDDKPHSDLAETFDRCAAQIRVGQDFPITVSHGFKVYFSSAVDRLTDYAAVLTPAGDTGTIQLAADLRAFTDRLEAQAPRWSDTREDMRQ